MFTEEFVVSPDDPVTNPHHCLGLAGTQPQVAVIEQEVDPVFLVTNRVFIGVADQFEFFDLDFVTELRTGVFVDFPGHPQANFLA